MPDKIDINKKYPLISFSVVDVREAVGNPEFMKYDRPVLISLNDEQIVNLLEYCALNIQSLLQDDLCPWHDNDGIISVDDGSLELIAKNLFNI